MFGRICRLVLAFFALVTLTLTSPGDSPQKKADPARSDPCGDPLPLGVIARLGSTRLYQERVASLLFSPDATTLAAFSSSESKNGSGNLRLWDVQSGKELPTQFVEDLRGDRPAFSADGKLVALAGDGGVRVWEVATGRVRHQFKVKASHVVKDLKFDPRGRRLAVVLHSVGVRLFSLEKDGDEGKLISSEWVDFLCFSQDGNTLAAVAWWSRPQNSVYVRWDTDSRKELLRKEFTLDTKDLGAVLSPDGALFACLPADGEVLRMNDPATGKEVWHTAEKTNGATRAQFSADGKRVTVSDRGGIVRVWRATDGKLLHDFKGSPRGIDRIALSNDGKLVALMGKADDVIHVFDVAKGEEIHALPGHRGGPLVAAFSPDGKTAFTADREWPDWSLRQWDPLTGKTLHATRQADASSVHHCEFSADGRLVATTTCDGTLRLWDAAAGKVLHTWKVATSQEALPNGQRRTVDVFSTLQFSAGANTLFGCKGRKICRWNVKTGEELPALSVPDEVDYTTMACAGPDEATVLVFDPQWRPHLLDANSGAVVRTFGDAPCDALAHAFSPDGRTFAVADYSLQTKRSLGVSFWEVASGRSRGVILDTGGDAALAFSPDGRLLAVGGTDGVRLIQPASLREVGRIDAYRGKAGCLVFSNDGKYLLVAGSANTALVCDVNALTAAKMPRPTKRTTEEMNALWDDLKGNDGAKAYRAIGEFATSGAEGPPFLIKRLKGVLGPDAKGIAQLIVDLDSDSYEVRQKASMALGLVGTRAEAALTRAFEKPASLEVRVRAERLLEKLRDPNAPPTEELISLRALEALANCGTSQADEILRELAQGEADSRLTQIAKMVLRRRELSKPTAP